MLKKISSIFAIVAIFATLGVCLAACNVQSYEEKLEEAGYTVEVMQEGSEELEGYNESLPEDCEGDLKWVIRAVNGSIGTAGVDFDYVIIMKFEKISDAKICEEDLYDNDYEEEEVYRISNTLIFGTEDGVNEAKAI